jgi:phosphoglycolate phosphatase-like HAD superfamily hydrolase
MKSGADLLAKRPGRVIFDIDGTVSDSRPRLPHLGKPEPDWESFFAESGADEPLPEGLTLALEFAALGTLVWLTGRPDRYREVTERWLGAQKLPTGPLHMRPEGDMRPAAHFKAERIGQLSADYQIGLIVDDDNQVVATLREAGWPVYHATWMRA